MKIIVRKEKKTTNSNKKHEYFYVLNALTWTVEVSHFIVLVDFKCQLDITQKKNKHIFCKQENCMFKTRIPRKASSHLLAQKSQEPQSECGY